ncbi:MAG: LysR family transcriptional regulator [Kofleriaceae bacterium]
MHDSLPDLELLRCFTSLHLERHLTRAATRVGLSQPAMSRALVRMRDAFGDPLFVRGPRGMLPTPRADALAPQIASVLEAAASLVRANPMSLARAFTLGTTDFFDADLLPKLIAQLASLAPNASIVTRPIGVDLDDALATGRLDLALGVRMNVPPGAMAQRLFADTFSCAVRKDHPVKRLTLARFVELSHLFIAPGGTPGGPVDSALADLGMTRRIAARTFSFLSAPAILARTDLILTAPRRILEQAAAPYQLRVLACPLELPEVSIYMMWHPRMQADPAHAWFRGLITKATRGPA